MNLLTLVPSFKRQIRQHVAASDTDSKLAGYLADAIEALNWRWNRTYTVTFTAPETYNVSPDVTAKDKRPIILMASIIYKVSTVDLGSFRDGDFAYDPANQGASNPLFVDIKELNELLPRTLARAKTHSLRGFSNGYNPESYAFLSSIGVFGAV